MTAGIRIEPLRVADAGEALTVQLAAYVSEAQLYSAPTIPPLLETLDEFRADIADPRVLAIGAWHGTRLVGSIRGRPDGARLEVARFTVAPDQQGLGIGRALLTALEAAVPPGIRVLWLVSGGRSEANIRMYRRAGYVEVGELVDSAGVRLLRLEKELSGQRPAASA